VRPDILDTGSLPWRPFENVPGVQFKVLRHHAERRGITLMLRFEAGADYPAHRHPEGEDYFVLDGTLTDGPHEYGAGTFVHHAPGSVHHPRSHTGCTLLVILPAHIQPAGPSRP